ncbi:MAG: NUDIX hydrolase [Variovorax sp.]|nr:MAG: NUDIX hydrolase [Variovorax sp.]
MNTRWKPNVTVAAVIESTVDGQQKFLLVEEQTRDGLKLNNPAGHLDPGESPYEGCVRETLEETAFHFKPTALVGVYMTRFERTPSGNPGDLHATDVTYMRFTFCGELGAHAVGQPLDEGIVRAVWLTEAEIRACAHMHRSPLLLTCLDDYLAGKRFPLDLLTIDPSVYKHAFGEVEALDPQPALASA